MIASHRRRHGLVWAGLALLLPALLALGLFSIEPQPANNDDPRPLSPAEQKR